MAVRDVVRGSRLSLRWSLAGHWYVGVKLTSALLFGASAYLVFWSSESSRAVGWVLLAVASLGVLLGDLLTDRIVERRVRDRIDVMARDANATAADLGHDLGPWKRLGFLDLEARCHICDRTLHIRASLDGDVVEGDALKDRCAGVRPGVTSAG